MPFEKRCFAQVDLDAIVHNYNYVSNTINDAKIMAVVKANAYGHGALAVAKLLLQNGAQYFGVSGLHEALELRKNGINAHILIFGHTSPKAVKTLAKYNISQTVYSLEYAQSLNAAAKSENAVLNIQIKTDTGMGRLGFLFRDNLNAACDEITKVCQMENLNAEGIFTHFAVADSKKQSDINYTKKQYALFSKGIEILKNRDITFDFTHCCNSAAAFMYPEFKSTLVRAGIVLYGEAPSAQLEITSLKTALQLKAVISQVKHIKKGSYESYGRTFCAKSDMKIATVCAGYADGYPRAMSNLGTVSINNKPAKVIGRVCMDQLMVDVTDIENVKEGDIATLYGSDAADSVKAVAKIANTINYEIICSVGHRVPRVYMQNGKVLNIVDYLEQ